MTGASIAVLAWLATIRSYGAELLERAHDEIGQDMVEYALIVGVVAVGIVLLFVIAPFGDAFTSLATRVSCYITGGSELTCDA